MSESSGGRFVRQASRFRDRPEGLLSVNPQRKVPVGLALDFGAPHGREALA